MSGGVLPWRDGLFLPGRMVVAVDEEDSPYLVLLSIVMEDDEPVLDSVHFARRKAGPPISPRLMRQVRVGEFVQAATQAMALSPVQLEDQGVAYKRVNVNSDIKIDTDDVSAVGRPSRITDAHLREVAAIYNAAVKSGNPSPRKAVQNDARWKPVPTQTAARWIRSAKNAGFIPKAAETTKTPPTERAKRPRRKD